MQGGGRGLQPLAGDDALQIGPDHLHGKEAEREDLAARKDGGGDLVFFRGRKDEDGVGRRFLKRLEDGVEGRIGEHVGLVNDDDLVPVPRGGEHHHLAHLADVVHPRIRGGVNLVYVNGDPLRNFGAGEALLAGFGREPLKAVQTFGEDARHGGFPRSPRTVEKIGVGHPPVLKGVNERLLHLVLVQKRGEILRPKTPGKDLVSHGMLIIP